VSRRGFVPSRLPDEQSDIFTDFQPASGWTPKAFFNTSALSEWVFHLTLDVKDRGGGTLAWSGNVGVAHGAPAGRPLTLFLAATIVLLVDA
jgi:hypothetical protein